MRKEIVGIWKICFAISVIISVGSGYAIEGNWLLTDINGSPTRENHTVTLAVDDFVYRNNSVRWSLQFHGCETFKYQMEVSENNLYIDPDTLSTDSNLNQSCLYEDIDEEKKLRAFIKRVFTFQIISSYMTFSDPTGTVIVKFQRIVPTGKVDITGNWIIIKINGTLGSQLIEINQQNLTFCQRKAAFDYKVVAKNKMLVQNLTNSGCESKALISAINASLYFFRREKRLEFYGANDELLAQMNFVMDLETARKLQKQQDLAKAANKNANDSSKAPAAPQAQPKTTIIPPTLSNNITDLVGKWKVKSIFNIPNFIPALDFIVTDNSIILSGGCNTHILPYSVKLPTPKNLTIGQVKSTEVVCNIDDDGLYVTGLDKMNGFSVALEGQNFVATISDKNGKIVYSLTRPAPFRTVISSDEQANAPAQVNSVIPFIPTAPAVKPPPAPPTPGNSVSASAATIPAGRYMILLLKRRDLPLKVASISEESLTFKVCNLIKLLLRYSKTNIVLLEQEKTANDCDTKQEQVYLSYLKESTQFSQDSSSKNTYILKNAQGEQVISLNLT